MAFYTVICSNGEGDRFSAVVSARDSRDAVCRFYSNFGDEDFDYQIVEVLDLKELVDCWIESHETDY